MNRSGYWKIHTDKCKGNRKRKGKPRSKSTGTDASSNHVVANENGDEGTTGGSDHGDDGPGADNAHTTHAEAQAALEKTTASFSEQKKSKQPKQTTQKSLFQITLAAMEMYMDVPT